jgi:hypothetical protein
LITEFLLDMVESAVSFLVSFIPEWDPPPVLTDGTIRDGVEALTGWAGLVGGWVPWPVVLAASFAAIVVRLGFLGVAMVLRVYAMIRGGAS